MDYTDVTTLITGAISGIGAQVLLVIGGVIVVAGSIFLAKWGFKKAKGGFNGKL